MYPVELIFTDLHMISSKIDGTWAQSKHGYLRLKVRGPITDMFI